MARVARDASLAGLPSMDEVWGWHKKLAEMGPRYTGSPGHVRFTDWLQQKFSAVPGFKLHHRPDHLQSMARAETGRCRSIRTPRWVPLDRCRSATTTRTRATRSRVASAAGWSTSACTADYTPAVLGARDARDRAGAGTSVHILARRPPDADRRFRAWQDLTGGRARLCKVREPADESGVPGGLRCRHICWMRRTPVCAA